MRLCVRDSLDHIEGSQQAPPPDTSSDHLLPLKRRQQLARGRCDLSSNGSAHMFPYMNPFPGRREYPDTSRSYRSVAINAVLMELVDLLTPTLTSNSYGIPLFQSGPTNGFVCLATTNLAT